MASPFPGMDPYLEDPAFWPDFHHSFISCWREAIADKLPEAYEARVDESINLVQVSPEIAKLFIPDISLLLKQRRPAGRKSSKGGTQLLEPVSIPHACYEEVRRGRIEIRHRPDRTLVAVLELLSPTNKMGDGFEQYCAKRTAMLLQPIHIVELDLLRGGKRPPLLQPLPQGDYFVYLSRANDRPNCQVYAWTVRNSLPMIPIPLKAPDKDIQIDLGKVFATTYKRGRYLGSLRYGKLPKAPLTRADAQWAKKLSAKNK